MLEQFHILTLSGKITTYDYYKGLERLTDNTGQKIPNRYPTVLRVVRQWRNLRMLRRGGRGNDGARSVNETKQGEVAVTCIACPQPGVNLPSNWRDAQSDTRFIYTMFLAFDACFRLKRKRISSWKRDPSLQDGWAYFVQNRPYLDWCKKMKDQKEMSTCTGLATLDHANTKFHEGYDETGKGAGLCARHEMMLANGMGALQVGERYANMDYIKASILHHIHILLVLLVSYDIVCQWSKKVIQRLKKLPPLVRLDLTLRIVRFVIPKLHILGHLLSCQEKFSLNFTYGVGQTDAEGIERVWAGLGGVATSLKEMGPGSHHDTLDDHIGHWNWRKVVGLGDLLKKRLINAVDQFRRQQQSWAEFSQKQQRNAPNWKRMVDDYELGHTTVNPYAVPVNGKTAQSVRLELAKEVEAKARKEMHEEERREAGNGSDEGETDDEDDLLPDLDISPSEFLFFGLEIEQQQRELRQDIKAVQSPTNKQLTRIVDRRTKLTRQIKRLRALQLGYMPVSLQIIATLPPSKSQFDAEDIPLYLPSQLSPSQRTSDVCKSELLDMELRLRDGQLNEFLNHLRQFILVKQRLLRYKKINARNQGATTRSRSMIGRQDKKVQLAAASYRAAWAAKLSLLNGDRSLMGWNQLLDEHIVGMEDLQETERRRVKAAKASKAAAARRALAGENPVPGAREKNRVASWIWHSVSQGELEADGVLYDGLRVEWCKTYARVKRWREEILLLQEEMRRCLVTLEWQAEQWEQRANIDTFEGERLEGSSAYAFEQAAIRRQIAERFERIWDTEEVSSSREFRPGDLELVVDPGMGDEDEDEDGSDMEQDDYEGESSEDDEPPQGDEDADEEEQEDEIDEEVEDRVEGEEEAEMEVDDQGEEEEELPSAANIREILTSMEEEQAV
ncbi:hypothetical protein VKT23_013070 [Stygiomarasmius scandens]|uniref:CxC2-like cysteine cluster KDZ transposase-associated domain-containing protein n=1 Tax=Marasmiellus scandens TaxID=2682957 RepID=A0ABR1J4J2_9AGAR